MHCEHCGDGLAWFVFVDFVNSIVTMRLCERCYKSLFPCPLGGVCNGDPDCVWAHHACP